MSFNFEKAAEACDRAAASGSLQQEMRAVYDVLKYKEEIQIAMTNAALARCSGPPPLSERLPFRDEEGQDWGRIEARIPKNLFHGLRNQKNFGDDGLTSDDGIKDLLKAFPQCRVTTVSGKTTVPVKWDGGVQTTRRRRARVVFGPGTITLAK